MEDTNSKIQKGCCPICWSEEVDLEVDDNREEWYLCRACFVTEQQKKKYVRVDEQPDPGFQCGDKIRIVAGDDSWEATVTQRSKFYINGHAYWGDVMSENSGGLTLQSSIDQITKL